MSQIETKSTEDWWDSNPFTYNGELGVGKQAKSISDLDVLYFETAGREYIKHTEPGTQHIDRCSCFFKLLILTLYTII